MRFSAIWSSSFSCSSGNFAGFGNLMVSQVTQAHEWFLLCLVFHLILEICFILILLKLFYYPIIIFYYCI